MNNKPFDLSVPQEDLNLAKVWWASLSNNQMKAFRDENFPSASTFREGEALEVSC